MQLHPELRTLRYCSTGHQSICDMGATILDGCLPDGSYRFYRDGVDYGGMCMLGTFSQYSLVKVDPSLQLETAVLVGCGVPTGWISAVYAGGVRAGDTVVIYGIGGIGGIGINAVQAAVHAGARHVVVVDPLDFKRETATKFGATHAFEKVEDTAAAVSELIRGRARTRHLSPLASWTRPSSPPRSTWSARAAR